MKALWETLVPKMFTLLNWIQEYWIRWIPSLIMNLMTFRTKIVEGWIRGSPIPPGSQIIPTDRLRLTSNLYTQLPPFTVYIPRQLWNAQHTVAQV